MPMSSMRLCCFDPVEMLFLADQQVLQQLPGTGVAVVETQPHASAVPLDGVLFELPVEGKLFWHGLADHHRAQPLHVGQRIQQQDALHELLGIAHFLDGLLVVLGGQPVISPVAGDLRGGEVLVDGRQLGRQRFVQEFDDLG